MRALVLGAVGVQAQGMVGDRKALQPGDRMLPLLYLGIVKLLDNAAIQTHQMIVVLTFVEFIDRLAAFKMTAAQDAGLLELREHPVNRRQPHVRPLPEKHPKHVLGSHVALLTFLEDFQNFQPRQRGLEPRAFEFVDVGHGGFLPLERSMPARAQRLQCMDHIASHNTMFDPFRQSARHGLYLAICAGLMACSNFDGASNRLASLVTPYKIDIVQGNFVSSEQVALLRTGMGRQAVRDLLGTPLLQSVFHTDRWDYVFTFRRKGEETQLRKVTVYFKNDGLDHFDADALPTEADFVASLDSGRKTVKVPLLDASEESLNRFPNVDKAPESPKVLPPLRASYPPLEPASP